MGLRKIRMMCIVCTSIVLILVMLMFITDIPVAFLLLPIVVIQFIESLIIFIYTSVRKDDKR